MAKFTSQQDNFASFGPVLHYRTNALRHVYKIRNIELPITRNLLGVTGPIAQPQTIFIDPRWLLIRRGYQHRAARVLIFADEMNVNEASEANFVETNYLIQKKISTVFFRRFRSTLVLDEADKILDENCSDQMRVGNVFAALATDTRIS